ncbi:uncharacterized protein RCC_10897 [Ramularia collo-cygni]|uniref:Hydrophobin n=1 Tax=Ramularia collo-cygni TaxID=112498 RepID=A0A2D3VRU4_9PEZI|nr:uncharacterized protein RCC_10897 [Ramularia collo-cygni]CZT25168.1 uncharacterized protein RCC_10897 [Ramularia collo-cygni]
MHFSSTLAALSTVLLANAAPQLPTGWEAPTCTDGGQLHCCSATFAGDLAPVTLLSDLACYDLTPADTNCIITNAPIDPLVGCKGVWSCCQVNTLAPLLGIFCSDPPGECVGDEAPPRCLDVLNDRFGHCPANGGGLLGGIL